ncbi:hypothetical protein [Emticicia sp. SJ17W-69]|uniref:hypothetical protein n=1 Tax=Emticicia sp. SJ17W-69 TaxID=3421657 RepID=UPI003EB7BF7D
MSNIDQNNFIAYLKFLESKYPQIKFSVEKLEALKKIDNQQISQYLQLVYEKFSLDKIMEENAFMKLKSDEELQKNLPVITPEIVEEVPKILPVIPVYETNSERSLQTFTPKPNINVEPKPSISIPKPSVKNVAPPNRTVSIDVAPKNNTFRNIFIILFLGVASYVIYEYYEYQKLGSAYALSNELLIRDSSKKDGNVLGSADLFGKNIDNNNVEIPTTSELKLYSNERQGGYYKVIVGDTPFISYLFNANAGYVYSKFFTTDKKEQDLYKAIFEPIKDDYYELKHLEFAYRAMIVNAIKNTPTMKGLVLKESCDVQPAMAKKMPLRIGQNQNKDRTAFHALVQLSDDNYYAIIANGFYNVSQINQIYLDGEPLTQQGKFTNKGKYFIWESCDKSITANSNGQPFDVFSTAVSVEETPANF